MIIFDKIISWWRRLPQKTRVQVIASVLLVFAGTEIIVLAPYIFDIALMIDVCGFVVVLAAVRSSVSVSMMQLREVATMLTKPYFALSRLGDMVDGLGVAFFPRWYQHCFLVDRVVRRSSGMLLLVIAGLMVTKALISHL